MDCGVFPYKVLLSVGESDSTITKLLRKHTKADDREIHDIIGECENGSAYHFKGGNCFIMLREYDLGLLVHELFHVVVFIYDNLGEQIDVDHQESGAYLIMHMLYNVLDYIKRHKNAKKQKR